jgi:tRNA-dihydrouridine synthase B
MAALTLGSLRPASPFLLAPMAGYTDSAMRTLCLEHGAGLAMTEVVNAGGLVRNAKLTWHLLETAPGERPVLAHLYGADPGVLAEAAARVAASGRFAGIDLNAGCPVRKIVAKGAGAALMRNPERIEAIVRALCAAVDLPVTVKTRSGLDPDRLNIAEVAHAVEAGGAAGLFVHARPASQRHGGAADWAVLARIKAERGIPVIGNGGIECPHDAVRMLRETGVDGVLIGRAAIGNPGFFAQAAACRAGRALPRPTPAERRAVIVEHLARLTDLLQKERLLRRHNTRSADAVAARVFRPYLLKYLRGCSGLPAVRRRLNALDSTAEIMRIVDACLF